MSNGSSIEFVEQCVHLGTKVYSDIFKKNIDSLILVNVVVESQPMLQCVFSSDL